MELVGPEHRHSAPLNENANVSGTCFGSAADTDERGPVLAPEGCAYPADTRRESLLVAY